MSSGVEDDMMARFAFAIDYLRGRDFDVVVGDCIGVHGVTSAPATERAAELTSMLLDPAIRAIVPPWGGELAIDVLSLLDFDAIGAAEPTWVLGYSDVTTVMLPLTTLCGVASVHAPNLMDTPYRAVDPLLHWIDVLALPTGSSFVQGAAPMHMARTYHDYRDEPTVREWNPQTPTHWKVLDGSTSVTASGRLIGGCLETLSMFAGTHLGDVARFAHDFAPEGTLVYLEIAEAGSYGAARMLHGLKLAGWFEAANAVLIGRSAGPDDADDFTQVDALRDALGGLGIPVVYDMDFGHMPPQAVLINGAQATVALTPTTATLTQETV